MCKSFLGLSLLLQNWGRKTFRVLLAPLGSAGREEMAPCLCFLSVHLGTWGRRLEQGEGKCSEID